MTGNFAPRLLHDKHQFGIDFSICRWGRSSQSLCDTFCSASHQLVYAKTQLFVKSAHWSKEISISLLERFTFRVGEYFPDRRLNWKMKRKFLQLLVGGGSWKVFCEEIFYKTFFSVKWRSFILFWPVKVEFPRIWANFKLRILNSGCWHMQFVSP